MCSIYSASFEKELQAYTYSLCNKIHKHLNIPIEEILEALKAPKCNAVDKNGCSCKKDCVNGSQFCKKHAAKKTKKTELEYIVINDTEYLYDPTSHHVYEFGKKCSVPIGKLNDNLTEILI